MLLFKEAFTLKFSRYSQEKTTYPVMTYPARVLDEDKVLSYSVGKDNKEITYAGLVAASNCSITSRKFALL